MEMLPNDIRQHRFPKSMRGYDTEEVDQFLEHLASTLETALSGRQRAEEHAKELEKAISKYRDQENALKKAVFTVERAMTHARETSLKEVESLKRTAELRAAQIVQEAEMERRRLEQDLKFLKESRQSYIEQLKAFCRAQLQTLENLEKPDRAREAAKQAIMPRRSASPRGVADPPAPPASQPATIRKWQPERVTRKEPDTQGKDTSSDGDGESSVAYPPPLVPDSAEDEH